MIFNQLPIKNAFLIELQPHSDERGFFARAFCKEEFRENGLSDEFVQANVSYNSTRGTLRGIHYQDAPHSEAKLVRCTQGSLFDVIVDLRRNSDTFGKWFGVDLTDKNHLALYIPEGCGHGFETLEDFTEAFYMVSARYEPRSEGGVRWDDPSISIDWPISPPTVISDKDSSWPLVGAQ